MSYNETLVQRLEKLFNSRGITRKITSPAETSNNIVLSAATIRQLLDVEADSESDFSEEDEKGVFSDNNPDFFYSYETPSSLQFDALDDRFFCYERLAEAEEGGNTRETSASKLGLNAENLQSAYEPIPPSTDPHGIAETVDNGTPGLRNKYSDSENQLLRISPSSKFSDAIDLQWKATVCMQDVEIARYKNNLATVIRDENEIDYLMVCCRSEIRVFGFDERNCPKIAPEFIVETKPYVTSVEDRTASTWPYFPHTINTISCHKNWISGSALSVCCDDGKVHIWHIENLLRSMQNHKTKTGPLSGVRITPDFSLSLNASVWGLDVKTSVDANGKRHYILAASANNRSVTLFYYHERTHRFARVETHPLLHNIPEVSLISYQVEGNTHRAHLSCGTIAGELVVFKFQFVLCAGKSENEENIVFETPAIAHRTRLQSDCWTTKPLHSTYFKRVASLRAMTGDYTIEEQRRSDEISNESRIMCPEIEFSVADDLGIAGYWQYFETPIEELSSPKAEEDSENAALCTWQEACMRTTLVIKSVLNAKEASGFDALKDIFLAVSTDVKLGLFRADTLFCCASTRPPFGLEIPTNEETTWCNRISITLLVPELSILVAATQIGLVSIMRLCEHRGAYGMRQEHIFPNAPKLVGDTFRTVVGMCVRNLSPLASQPRFFLYLIYSDGLTLTYQLSGL